MGVNTMKWAVIASVGWVLGVMGLSFLALWYAWENRIGGRANFEERAAQLGNGAGVIAALGLAAIWGYWYYREKSGKS
jgi:hypothetical protein